MSRADEALKKHADGYNCAQAVACVFAEDIGIDEAALYKLTEGFGFGMGNGRGVCGAIAGAAAVAGMLGSDGDIENAGQTKKSTYKTTGAMQSEFTERAKRLICLDIKRGNDGRAFTSCDECVRIATEIAEEMLDLK